VGFLGDRVDGFDVASGGELRLALDAGADPRGVSFAGPGKSEAELTQAVAAGVLMHLESTRELRLLGRIAQRLGRAARVAVRVNPDFELRSSTWRMGGGPKQFGIDAERVPEVLAEIGRDSNVVFEGFHLFAGAQNLRAAELVEAQGKALDLAIALAAHAPCAVKSVNLGGGFGIPHYPHEHPLDLAAVGEGLQGVAARASARLPGAELVIELGRYIVGEAGFYVTRIVDRKVSRDEVFLVTDGGMHHHLAAAGVGQFFRKNFRLDIVTGTPATAREVATVVGPLCTPLDVLGARMDLPVAEPGDLVVVFQSGAYGRSASPTAFLSHPAPLEVLV
jgi:diaminopimelate decarboxylase